MSEKKSKDGKQKTSRVTTILHAYSCRYDKARKGWRIFGIPKNGEIYHRLKEIGLKLIPCEVQGSSNGFSE